MDRIVIVGATGTGKTTLAYKLGAQTGFPVIDPLTNCIGFRLDPVVAGKNFLRKLTAPPKAIVG